MFFLTFLEIGQLRHSRHREFKKGKKDFNPNRELPKSYQVKVLEPVLLILGLPIWIILLLIWAVGCFGDFGLGGDWWRHITERFDPKIDPYKIDPKKAVRERSLVTKVMFPFAFKQVFKIGRDGKKIPDPEKSPTKLCGMTCISQPNKKELVLKWDKRKALNAAWRSNLEKVR